MEGRDLNDIQIINATVQTQNSEGKPSLQVTLPDQSVLFRELPPEGFKGKIVSDWCDEVRRVVDEQYKRLRIKDADSDIPVAQSPAQPSVEEDPAGFLSRIIDKYSKEVGDLEQRIDNLKAERKEKRNKLEQWERAYEALRGETDE